MYFEQYLVKNTIMNFEELSTQGVNNVTKNHDLWANMIMSFTDIKEMMQAVAV